MATNTGIEVAALRPAASAGDYYVRPEQSNSGIQQGLARLAGTMNKKNNEAAKITAQELALTESLDSGNVEALHNREAYAQESPAVMAYLNEIRGKNHASALVSKLTSDWQEKRAGFDDTGADFESFLREGLAQGVEDFRGNRYMMAGASGVFAEATQNLRAQNRQYVDGRTRASLQVEFSTDIGTTALGLANGSLTLEAASLDIESRIQTIAAVGGMTLGEASEQSFKELIAFSATKEGGSTEVLQLINSHPYITGPNGKEPTRLEGILMVEKAIQSRSDDAYREQERTYVQAERAKEQLREDTATTIQTLLIKDPTTAIPDELKSAYVKSGGQLATLQSYEANALALSKKPVTPSHIEGYNRILSNIYKETYNPTNRVTIDNILVDASLGFIHPSQVADLMQKVQQASQVAPLGQKKEVVTARKRFVESIVGISSEMSAKTRKRAARLQEAFDVGFREEVTKWYEGGNADPNFENLTYMVKTVSSELKAIADIETEDIQADVLHTRHIKQAVKWAKDNQAFGWNPSLDDIEAGISANKIPKAVMKTLLSNPMQIIEVPASLGGGQRPVIEMLDAAFGDGAAYVWFEAHKGDF